MLVKYDETHNLSKKNYAAFLDLFKENQYKLQYVIRNVFRYDQDGDKSVTYDELTDFCVERYFGKSQFKDFIKGITTVDIVGKL